VNNAVRIETTTVKAAGFDAVQAAVLAFLLFCGLFTTSVRAQVNEAFADAAGEIETARSMAQTERKAIVARNMTLTAGESEHFWPLYNRYRYEMSVLQDRQVAIISDFAAQYETLDDVEARRILDKWVAYESDLVKLRARYIKRFAKVLPGTKLARYFQIENRLDAMSNLTTASRVPLAH
jgi:hypothetical protein